MMMVFIIVDCWCANSINHKLNPGILGLQQSSRVSFSYVFVTAVNLKIKTKLARQPQQLG